MRSDLKAVSQANYFPLVVPTGVYREPWIPPWVHDADEGDQILLSHDRGWYDPAQIGGGSPKPFTYLTDTFLPRLRAVKVDEQTIQQITVFNPWRAFSRIG